MATLHVISCDVSITRNQVCIFLGSIVLIKSSLHPHTHVDIDVMGGSGNCFLVLQDGDHGFRIRRHAQGRVTFKCWGGCSQHRARKHVKDERFQRPPSILTEFWCSHHTLLLVTVSKLVSMPTKPRTLALWPLFTSGSRILVVGIRTHPRQETTSEVPWCFFFKGQASPPDESRFFPQKPQERITYLPPLRSLTIREGNFG